MRTRAGGKDTAGRACAQPGRGRHAALVAPPQTGLIVMLHIVQTPAELLSALWRHRWLAGAVVVAGSAISLQVALMQPRSFESSALIQIDNLHSVSPEGDPRTSLASSAWLEQIEARLMRRDHLLQ